MRRAFTLLELLVVICIVGILALVAVPRLQQASSETKLRSAKREVTALLTQARATAIQNGRSTSFVRSGNQLSVVMDNGSGPLVVARRDLSSSYGATLTASRDTVPFDPRGLIAGNSSTIVVGVQIGAARDSVCVVALGKIVVQGCTL